MNTPQPDYNMKIIPLTEQVFRWYILEDYSYERKILASIKYTRRFTGERLDPLEIKSIIEMARWAPSIGNIQPWELIIVDDPMEIHRVARLHPAGRVFEKAGVLIFIVTDPEQSPHHIIDGGSLMAYLCLAASIKGYAVMILNLNNDPVIKSELNIPPSKYLLGLVAIGKEAGASPIMPRKSIDMITYHNKYGLRR